jgi:ATP-dependent DNA helicase RecG
MLQRAKFATTSSRSPTSKAGPALPSPSRSQSSSQNATHGDTPIQFVKGVGPGLGAVFKSRGIQTIRDLFYFLPRHYEDRSKIQSIAELKEGVRTTVSLQVVSQRTIPLRSAKFKKILEVRCQDANSSLLLKWFHAPKGLDARLKPGTQIFATGQVKIFNGRAEMIHPELSFGLGAATSEPHVGRWVPIYTEIDGIPTRVLRKVLWEACQGHLQAIPDDLPPALLEKYGFPRVSEALRSVHFPNTPAEKSEELLSLKTPAHSRLIFEEFFKFEHLILKQKQLTQREKAIRYGSRDGLSALAALQDSLPFKLTQAQVSALTDLCKDLASGHPMNRLIQGDVGSGKTAISLLAAGLVASEGGQSALMAPTEILAEQHFLNCKRLLGERLHVRLLTGRTGASERAKLFSELRSGRPMLLVGTHALIEEPVKFANLDLVMIDEQHRFGVEQRLTLKQKGCRHITLEGEDVEVTPHFLVLTATPIPRTLALTVFGELDVSTLRELPPGRSPILTKVVTSTAEKNQAMAHLRDQLSRGHQAYLIYPLVKESEAEGFTQLRSAIAEAERLQREVLPEFKVGLLHGQLPPEEKAQVMSDFKANKIHALVSTTVVEVGVDVPNATVLLVEHADRFGLSQLHQLRGRIGRGTAASTCYLVTYLKEAERTAKRLDVLERTQDGFEIAEADLQIRGPGEFLGTRQSGSLPFKIADLVRDQKWLLLARDEAVSLSQSDPDVTRPENLPFRRYLDREGHRQMEWFRTS